MTLTPKIPPDFWQLILKIFAWAARIPIACFIIFTAGCISYLGFFLAYRATVWFFVRYLRDPW